MKKNFAKKLSVVLALAMAVSTLAPAASADACNSSKFKTYRKTVYENGTNDGEYSYTVANIKKGYNVKWSVSGDAKEYISLSKKSTKATKTTVNNKITVDTEGELAAKNAKATVTAKVYNTKGKLVKTVKDSVQVKVSATDVAIKADTTVIAVGEKLDLNRTLTPANSTSKTYWTVDGDATIDKMGVLTADKAGEYNVTATVKNAKDSKTLATATQKVSVKEVVLKSVKQTKYNTLELVAAGNTAKLKDAVDDIVVTDTKTNVVYNVKLANANATDATKVTVVTYNDDGIVSGNDCTVTYDGVTVKFTATDAKIADVAVSHNNVVTGVPTLVLAQLVDKNGVVVEEFEIGTAAPAGPNKVGYVNFDVVSNDGYVNDDQELVLLSDGATATAVVEYHTYDYDATTGNEVGALNKTFTITAVKDNTTVTGFKMTIEPATTPFVNWNLPVETNNTLMVNDEFDSLGAITPVKAFFHITDSNGVDVTDNYSVVSSDKSMLLLASEELNYAAGTQPNVMLNTNAIDVKGIRPGTAHINVVNDVTGAIEYSFPVVIKAARTLTQLDMPGSFIVSSEAGVINTVATTIEGLDQYGDTRQLDLTTASVKVASASKNAAWVKGYELNATEAAFVDNGDGTLKLTITPAEAAATEASYQLQVTVADNEGKYLTKTIALRVVNTTGVARTYALKISDTNVDLAVPSTLTAAVASDKEVEIKVAAMAKGAVVEYLNAAAIDKMTITAPNGRDISTQSYVTSGAGITTIDAYSVAGSVVTKNMPTGTYRVHVVTNAASTGNIVRTFDGVINVKDTQPKATAFVNDRVPVTAQAVAGNNAGGSVAALFDAPEINDLIKIYYEGVEVSPLSSGMISAARTDGAFVQQNGTALYIGTLQVTVTTLGGLTVKTLVDINRTFTLLP